MATRLAAVVSAVTLAVTRISGAQQTTCDDRILSLAGGGQPYKSRGDRCEGTYKQQVGAGLFLRSIYQSFGNFDLTTSKEPLVIEWSPPPMGTISVRADGWVGGEPYRMDASPSPSTKSFNWDTMVLRALSSGSRQPLTRRELAVQAWADSAGVSLFLPVRIWQHERPKPCGPITFVLWAMSRPESVYVDVGTVDPSGTVHSLGRRELGRQPYPLNGPLGFELPEIKAPGIYRVNLTARLGDDPWSRQYLVYIGDDTRLSCS
ncbi:MAG TPA: hypothetical protein VLB12_08905 [Gemmatimonadales bacterium]|nr:hypothetical protein [Gemmatimonadales bacterium]